MPDTMQKQAIGCGEFRYPNASVKGFYGSEVAAPKRTALIRDLLLTPLHLVSDTGTCRNRLPASALCLASTNCVLFQMNASG